MSLKVGSFTFLAESSQMDFTGKLMLSVLGNRLLDSAGMHAEKSGFGMAFLNEHHYTWVLSRLAIEWNDMPGQDGQYTVDTWIESVKSLFSKRNFMIKGADGHVMGYARSIWAMIDVDTRRPVNLLTLRDGIMAEYVDSEKDCPIDGPGKINVKAETPALTTEAQYTDIDINGHFNSIRYIERILNLVPIDEFKNKRMSRFEISYHSESFYGDKLDIYYDNNPETGLHLFEIRKHDSDDVVCKAKICFEARS